MATGMQAERAAQRGRQAERERERERLHWNLCFENEMSNCRAQQREGQGRAGRQAGRVCESISEFPVVSWLLIMRVELPECLQNARRIYVNSALSSAILLAFSFFYAICFFVFFFWLCF